MKTYSELIKIPTFIERFRYLKLQGIVADETFGSRRYLNQVLYNNSEEWKSIRRQVIIRDNGCDLGMQDHTILGRIFVHHMNPLTIEDLVERPEVAFDPENLICCSFDTHNAIHYGDESKVDFQMTERKPNDTIPWR